MNDNLQKGVNIKEVKLRFWGHPLHPRRWGVPIVVWKEDTLMNRWVISGFECSVFAIIVWLWVETPGWKGGASQAPSSVLETPGRCVLLGQSQPCCKGDQP